MTTLRQIHNDLGPNLCRACINEEYGTNLTRKECLYSNYQYKCSCCGELRNIVANISIKAKIKLLLKHRL